MVRDELSVSSGQHPRNKLMYAWSAWRSSLIDKNAFGARSFGWIALGLIFDHIAELEELQRIEDEQAAEDEYEDEYEDGHGDGYENEDEYEDEDEGW